MKILIISFLFLSACQKSTDTPTPIAPKTLSSSAWTSDGPNWTLDFQSNGDLTVAYGTGGSCWASYTSTYATDADTGTITIYGAVALTTESGMPTCSQFNGNWTYSVLSDQTLWLCNSSNVCVDFQ